MLFRSNNLIENAIKYADKNSEVMIALRENNDQMELSIADEGPGIDNADKKKVFQKHYRIGNEATKNSKGTGLGLYLVKRIVTVHKGHISIQDRKPKGSIFVITMKCMKDI